MMMKIPFNELEEKIFDVFLNESVSEEKAKTLSLIMAQSTLDGVNSHGINRLPLLIEYVRRGVIKINAEPQIENEQNVFAQINGNYNFGILNALFATNKSMELAGKNGIGFVTLKHTNHWHRAGTYGWHAAEKGFILICWTNTIQIVPPHGSSKELIGNNPFVIAIPREEGHLVLDMATSQFSYGKVATYARTGKKLEVNGGYDKDGNLTNDAKLIREGGRHLPIGFWKGSALTIMLDLFAATLAGGKTSKRMGNGETMDTGASQIFIAIDPKKFGDETFQQNLINETLKQFENENEISESDIRYPGQETLKRRKENMKYGIPVEKEIWEKVNSL